MNRGCTKTKSYVLIWILIYLHSPPTHPQPPLFQREGAKGVSSIDLKVFTDVNNFSLIIAFDTAPNDSLFVLGL